MAGLITLAIASTEIGDTGKYLEPILSDKCMHAAQKLRKVLLA